MQPGDQTGFKLSAILLLGLPCVPLFLVLFEMGFMLLKLVLNSWIQEVLLPHPLCAETDVHIPEPSSVFFFF